MFTINTRRYDKLTPLNKHISSYRGDVINLFGETVNIVHPLVQKFILNRRLE